MSDSALLDGAQAAKPIPPARGMLTFYLICFGQIISIIGSGLTGFAVRIWAYDRTGLATEFALIALCYTLPGLLVLPITGVLVDRYDKRLMMLLSDIGAGCGTVAIWFLLSIGQLEIWHIYLAVSVMSACGALRGPAYAATTPLLVPKEQLGRANGLIQFGGGASQTLAPFMAGALMAGIGLQGITLIDMSTFVFALLTLLVVRLPKPDVVAQIPHKRGSFLKDALYGWQYIRERPGLLGLLLITVFITGSERMVVVLIAPLVLGFSNAQQLGVVSSIAGIGIILGAVTMSIWGGPKRRIQSVLGFTLLRALLLFLGGLQPNIVLVAVASSLFLFFAQIGGGSAQALWQTKVAADVQGRVFAMLNLVTGAITPLVLVLAGTLADNVFQPLLNPGGPLAGSVGQIIGTGPGRGIGLIFIVLGLLNTILVVGAYLFPRIRRVEIELPDAMGDHLPVQDNSQQIVENRTSKNDIGETKMKRLGQWLKRILLGLLALVIILSLIGTWFVVRSLPEEAGTVNAPQLSAPVKIIRDKSGIPHIYAENNHDLLFAQGYVHAQDRLWQMELNRRAGSGTLSEIFGKATLDSDRSLRLMGLRRAAEKMWAQTGPENRAFLQAYADGVNHFIDTHRDRLPVEFTILGVNPAPWTPVDTLSWGNVLAMNLSGNYTLELLRAQMIAKLGEKTTQELFPPPLVGTPIIIPDGVNGYSGLSNARFDELTNLSEWVGLPDPGLGSNDWVVSGSRTVTGKPFLANDTHLAVGMPSIWYEADLHGGDFNTEGFTLPGVPLIILGHNDHIAWGTSNLGNDVQDSYLEKLNDTQKPTQYQFEGKWYDLQVIPETILVKGSAPVTMNILMTRHGPIMNADRLATEQPLALRWTLQDGNHLFDAVVKINLSKNWSDFNEALRLWDVPGQNFVYADTAGNIGYHSSGKTPIRAPGHLGTVPVPGWTGQYEWQGYIPYDAMPKTLNPKAGFVATANNKITPDDYPYVLVRDWYPGERAQRITELLNVNTKLSIEDMEKIQADTKLIAAETLRPYMLAIQPANDLQTQAIAKLKDWDLRLEANSVGGAIYETWFQSIITNTIGDELGSDLLNTYLAGGYQRHSSQVEPLIIKLDG